MTIARLSGLFDTIARVLGFVLVVLGVGTILTQAPSDDFVIGFCIFLALAGATTVVAVKKKNKLWRVIAGLSNGFMIFVGVVMFFVSVNDSARPVRIVLGGFLIVACGLSLVAHLLPVPPSDIVTKRSSDTI